MINNNLFPHRIVCIHGNSSSSRVFECLKELEGAHLCIEAIDLNGHGKNQNSKTEQDFTIATYKAQLIKAINDGNGPVLLIGNSLGGNLAIEIAEKIDHLKGLVIMGTPVLKKPINFEECTHPLPELATYLTEKSTDHDIYNAIDSTVVDKTVISHLKEDFKITDGRIRSVMAADLSSSNAFGDEYSIFTQLDVPRYIINGNQDALLRLDYLGTLVKESSGDVTLIKFDNCGHYPSVDRPDLFMETVQKIAHAVFE
ncbi:hypothetical protein BST97_08420 [Nonlabens spongiae]|uniref:AB hydrolase-1 domain-containing protein n=1 Tax=Nonlabens spongiae TaxID=331648 RepID=A0A1W6MKD0_9FLAO|nr:alpha/beta hydrolase [Nonlabens spongiae]ARN78022.1 hypothetical protein BST97_08420 [Nonlabens spongiae]